MLGFCYFIILVPNILPSSKAQRQDASQCTKSHSPSCVGARQRKTCQKTIHASFFQLLLCGFFFFLIIFMMSFRSRRNKEDAKCLVWLGVSFMDICLKYKVEP